MIPQPPPGQGPVDPRGAFSPPPPSPAGMGAAPPPPQPGFGSHPPPRMMMPPMMMPPPYFPPPPARSGGLAKAILTTLATTIFGLSIALNIYLLIFSGVMSGAGDLE